MALCLSLEDLVFRMRLILVDELCNGRMGDYQAEATLHGVPGAPKRIGPDEAGPLSTENEAEAYAAI